MKTSLSATVYIALFAVACGSKSSSPSQDNGRGDTTPGSGGSQAGTSASSSGGSSGGGSSGGASSSGGSPVGQSGGNPGASSGNSGNGGAAGNADAAGGGGAGPSDSATGGGPAGAELITSGPNAYWNTQAQLTELTSGTADLSVDDTTTYQKWSGFGGCFNEKGWDALSVLSPDQITNALTLLFDANDGANFIYGRLPVGSSDYSMSRYTLDDTAGDFSMANFSIARDEQMLIPYIKAAMSIRPDIHLWASPWIPPDWMKDSSSNMKSDAQTQGAYALYLARFVEEYAKQGLTIEAIHPQNEPGYASVHWTQSEFIDFFGTYLGPTFAQRNLTAEIWCGTMSAPSDGPIATTLAQNTAAMKYVKGFGLQWNLQTTVATLAPDGPVWQTEHKCGNYNFATPYWDQSRYNPNMPQNDHLYGEESWQLIRDWTVAGVNAYSAWNMVLDTLGMSLNAWPQNALLVVDRSAKQLIVTPAYYVFRHFSQFIAPGATRIKISGSTDALAFKNPDGSIITELYNKTDSVETLTVGVGGRLEQFAVPSHGWATLRTMP